MNQENLRPEVENALNVLSKHSNKQHEINSKLTSATCVTIQTSKMRI